MHPKEIHVDFTETIEKESLSYNTVKTWAAELKRGRESVDDDGLSGRPRMPPLIKMSRSCTPLLCVIVGRSAKHS